MSAASHSYPPPYMAAGYHHHHHHHHHHQMVNSMTMTKGKQLMSFQNYVRTLNNAVDEATACKKYKDFMAELSQSRVGRFFEANKDREWFRLKYHPLEGQKIFQQQNANFLKRLKVFNDLNNCGHFDQISYTAKSTQSIIDLMDTVIVLLEDDSLTASDLSQAKLAELRDLYIPTKPTSVVIEDISVDTTLAEIQTLCLQASPHLVRLTSLDPYYVPGGYLKRKLVAIYKQDIDIRDVCWKLSRMKLNNKPLNVSINRCLTNRILCTNAIANCYTCILSDIRKAVILILNFDELRGLYGKRKQILENIQDEPKNEVVVKMELDPEAESQSNGKALDDVAPLSPPGSDKSVNEDEEDKPFDVASLDEEKEKEKRKLCEFKFNTDMTLYRQASKLAKSKNPVLENAHIFLIDYIESSSSIYQLAKVHKDLRAEQATDDIDELQNDKLASLELAIQNLPFTLEESTRFLDKMLFYLRIVHSFDYYKKTIYKQEDELTLRMSVIHIRDDFANIPDPLDGNDIRSYLANEDKEFEKFGFSQSQKYVTKDEERFNYKSYGKVITDELTSYAQRIQKSRSTETEEVYKCKHCTRVFQKLSDIGRHFVSKHRWAIDAIELETDFFNAYLFDSNKIDPTPHKKLLEMPPNRFAKIINLSQMGEDPDLLKQTMEAYSKMESFVREPAPRTQVEADPRNESIVDYTDISFDDAI